VANHSYDIPQILVMPASGSFHEDEAITMFTSLFRKNADLETVLGIAKGFRQHLPEDAPWNIVSVGASIGAEGDSILWYLTKMCKNLGTVSLTGIDVNPRAVQQANLARHSVNPPMVPSEAGKVPWDLYQLEPFKVSQNAEDHGSYVIDTSELRSRHNVRYVLGNLACESIDGIAPADVIFCNNVLYHLKLEEADSIVTSMASSLASNGVMSFGNSQRQVGFSSSQDEHAYIDWRERTGVRLAQEGIEPVLYEDAAQKIPYVFRRNA
jgi:chemotaxis methyl-accepting protein methylase